MLTNTVGLAVLPFSGDAHEAKNDTTDTTSAKTITRGLCFSTLQVLNRCFVKMDVFIFIFFINYLGTGSTPEVPHGLQRKMRLAANFPPFNGP